MEGEDRADDEQGLDHRDGDLGPGVAQRGAHGRDIGGAARGEITGPGAFHDGCGQGERPLDELFTYPGGRPLSEAVSHVPGEAGEQQLGDGEAEDGEGQPVHGGDARAVPDPVDDASDQPGPGEPGRGGERVERDHGGEGARVQPDEPQGGAAYVTRLGDREVAVHR